MNIELPLYALHKIWAFHIQSCPHERSLWAQTLKLRWQPFINQIKYAKKRYIHVPWLESVVPKRICYPAITVQNRRVLPVSHESCEGAIGPDADRQLSLLTLIAESDVVHFSFQLESPGIVQKHMVSSDENQLCCTFVKQRYKINHC